jgi:hypothetical protein
MVARRATDDGGHMTTLHVENTIRDYETWKSNFDKFDRARRDRGVTRYRVSRAAEDPTKVMVDLEFDSTGRAEEFREFLGGVMRTPQALSELVEHQPPTVFEVMEDTVLT